MNTNSKIEDGGAAFARPGGYNTDSSQRGMSLRDYFAGQALIGVLSNPKINDINWDFSRECYIAAEAMLRARRKEKPVTCPHCLHVFVIHPNV